MYRLLQKGLNVVHVAAKDGSLDVIEILVKIDRELVISSKVKVQNWLY